MRKEESLTANLDWPLFSAIIAMLIMGLATVYSVAYNEEAPSLFAFSEKYGRQLFWIIFSLSFGLFDRRRYLPPLCHTHLPFYACLARYCALYACRPRRARLARSGVFWCTTRRVCQNLHLFATCKIYQWAHSKAANYRNRPDRQQYFAHSDDIDSFTT